jgi:hypothetical protein
MHQTTHLFTGWREPFAGAGAYDYVKCLGCCQVMAYRANTAKPLYQDRGFPIGPSLHETFESAEFDYMQTGLGDIILIVKVYGDFSVPFHAGYGFYSYFL